MDRIVKSLKPGIIGPQRRGFKLFKKFQMKITSHVEVSPIPHVDRIKYTTLWQDDHIQETSEDNRIGETSDI
jgi:hypothetical protein